MDTGVDVGRDSLVPRPSHHPLAVCKNGERRLGPFITFHTQVLHFKPGSMFFASRTFETPALGAEATRRNLNLVLSWGTPPSYVHLVST